MYEELADNVADNSKKYKPIEREIVPEINRYKKEYGNPPEINWDELKARNPDIVAWIWIPYLKTSYPVAYTKEPEYYLRRDIDKKWAIAGTIFIDYQNKPDFSSINTLIYGHNMGNDTMFGPMYKLLDKKNYPYNPYIWILTPDNERVYKMFTAFVESPVGDAYILFDKETSDPFEFESWINKMIKRKIVPYESPEHDITLDSHLITLSSCTDTGLERQVVMANNVYIRK